MDNGTNFTFGLIVGIIFGFIIGGFIFKAGSYKQGQIDCIEGSINFKPINKTHYIWKD